jgi:hypothetical protein
VLKRREEEEIAERTFRGWKPLPLLQANIVGCPAFYYFYKKTLKLVNKTLDFVRGRGMNCFKSGAYTKVREHFEAAHNDDIGQKMMV